MSSLLALLALSASLEAERGLLASPDVSARRGAVLRIGWLGKAAAPAVPSVAAALRDPDVVVRHDAANALVVRIGPAAAVVLGEALADKDGEVRWRALDALTRLGPDAQAATPALVERLKTAKSVVTRVRVAMALGRMGTAGRAALPALIAAASDRGAEWTEYSAHPSSVCEAAVYAVRRIDPDALKAVAASALPSLRGMLVATGDDEDTLAARRGAMRAVALLGRHAAPALPDLLSARSARSAGERDFVAACLSVGKDGRDFVVGRIADPTCPRGELRALLKALHAHPGLGADAVRALIPLLAHDDEITRCLAAWVLSAQGPAAEPAIPALVTGLTDPALDQLRDGSFLAHDLTCVAAEALARIGPKAVPALLDALKGEKTRTQAVVALGRMGPAAKAAVPALRPLLAPPTGPHALAVAEALIRIGDDPDEPIRVVVANLESGRWNPALEYLAYRGHRPLFLRHGVVPPGPPVPRRAIPTLLDRLDHADTRSAATTVLRRMTGDADRIVPGVTGRLRQPERGDREYLLGLLAGFGPAAMPAVADILWCVREDRSDGVRRAAFRALEAIGPAARDAAPMLALAAADPNDPARAESLLALGRVAPRAGEVIDPLVKIMCDPAGGRPGRRDAQLDAARVLANLDPLVETTVPRIREARLSDYALIRIEATAALIRHGDAGTPLDLLLGARTDTYDPAESYPVLPHWLDAIESLGPLAGRAVPLLVGLLTDPTDGYDEDSRWRAARVLGAIGPAARAALPRLRVLSRGDAPTAGFAAEAIRRIEGGIPGR